MLVLPFFSDPTLLFYETLVLAVLTAAGLAVFLFLVFRGRTPEDAVKERLQRIRSPQRVPGGETDEKWEKTLSTLGRFISPKEKQDMTILQRKLSCAGYRGRNAAARFFGVKVLAAVVLGGAAVVYSGASAQGFLHGFIAIAGATALGLYGPNLWVRMRTNRRNERLSRSLPNALDLLVVCTEAGLGLDMALKRVGKEISPTAPELSKELALISLELNSGIPRQRALANLKERNSLEELQTLSNILIQADKFGTSVARALRVSADSIRTKRRQAAEELAAKTTVKLSFPLVLFILPATVLVVIGPGIVKIIQILLPTLTR